jgi:hypothetical protein
MPVVMDRGLLAPTNIAFNAGTHRDLIHMSVDDFLQLTKPARGLDFAMRVEAWRPTKWGWKNGAVTLSHGPGGVSRPQRFAACLTPRSTLAKPELPLCIPQPCGTAIERTLCAPGPALRPGADRQRYGKPQSDEEDCGIAPNAQGCLASFHPVGPRRRSRPAWERPGSAATASAHEAAS